MSNGAKRKKTSARLARGESAARELGRADATHEPADAHGGSDGDVKAKKGRKLALNNYWQTIVDDKKSLRAVDLGCCAYSTDERWKADDSRGDSRGRRASGTVPGFELRLLERRWHFLRRGDDQLTIVTATVFKSTSAPRA
jgi:hypothetical protein